MVTTLKKKLVGKILGGLTVAGLMAFSAAVLAQEEKVLNVYN